MPLTISKLMVVQERWASSSSCFNSILSSALLAFKLWNWLEFGFLGVEIPFAVFESHKVTESAQVMGLNTKCTMFQRNFWILVTIYESLMDYLSFCQFLPVSSAVMERLVQPCFQQLLLAFIFSQCDCIQPKPSILFKICFEITF